MDDISADDSFRVWLGQVSGAVLSLEHMTEVAGGPCLRHLGIGGFLSPPDALLLLWRDSQNISGAPLGDPLRVRLKESP